MRRLAVNVVFWFLLALLAALFLWPLCRVIGGGFWVEGRFTARYLLGVFRNPIYAEGLLRSFRIGIGTTVVAMAIALPLAWLANRYEFTGKRWLTGLILVPMILPPFVGAIGIQQMLGPYGAINALFGLGPVDWLGRGRYAAVVLLQALGLYPILYLNAAAALANVDPAMEEAAENLGCTGIRKFFRVTAPLIAPGLFAGGAIVFIWSFTELGTPLMLNYTRCAPVQVFDALKDLNADPFPYALVFVMLVCGVFLYGISKWAFGRHAWAMQAKATHGFEARPIRGRRGAAVAAAFGAVCLLALLPHVGVILTSFSEPGSWYRTPVPARFTVGHYVEALGHEMTVRAIRNSLGFSLMAVAFDVTAGIAVAFVVVRSSHRLRGWLDALAMAPLAVPGLVLAFGYLSLSSMLAAQPWVRANPAWERLFDVRVNPTLFLVVAYAVRRLPYMVRSAVAGLQQTSTAFEEAAANLGAGPLTVARRVTLPLIAANLIAGALLAFAFSMLEVSDSLMLAQRADYFPITKTIYELFQLLGSGRHVAAALGVWAMAFLAVTIVGGSLLLGRRLGALFRV